MAISPDEKAVGMFKAFVQQTSMPQLVLFRKFRAQPTYAFLYELGVSLMVLLGASVHKHVKMPAFGSLEVSYFRRGPCMPPCGTVEGKSHVIEMRLGECHVEAMLCFLHSVSRSYIL